MIFTIGTFYTEPGCEFKISHEVGLLIKREILNYLKEKSIILEKNKTVSLLISTNKNIESVEVKGPDIKKDIVNWGLWLPYNEIAKKNQQLPKYLSCLFDAIIIVLKRYSVKEDDLKSIQEKIETKVIDNPVYAYNDDNDTPELDLSFLNE